MLCSQTLISHAVYRPFNMPTVLKPASRCVGSCKKLKTVPHSGLSASRRRSRMQGYGVSFWLRSRSPGFLALQAKADRLAAAAGVAPFPIHFTVRCGLGSSDPRIDTIVSRVQSYSNLSGEVVGEVEPCTTAYVAGDDLMSLSVRFKVCDELSSLCDEIGRLCDPYVLGGATVQHHLSVLYWYASQMTIDADQTSQHRATAAPVDGLQFRFDELLVMDTAGEYGDWQVLRHIELDPLSTKKSDAEPTQIETVLLPPEYAIPGRPEPEAA